MESPPVEKSPLAGEANRLETYFVMALLVGKFIVPTRWGS